MAAANSLVVEMSAFYKAYAEAFHARSGTQIADFYCTPCISMRGDASIHLFQSRSETEKFFQGVAGTYYEEGLRRSEIKNLEVVPIGGRALLATMDWLFYRGDGTLLKQWRQSYNLVRIEGLLADSALDLPCSLNEDRYSLADAQPVECTGPLQRAGDL